MITISRPRMNGSHSMDARSVVMASTSQPSLVVDDSSDLLWRHEHAKVGHAAALHRLTRVGAGPGGRRQVANAADAIGLAELGALVHEVDVVIPVGELPDFGPVGEVGAVGPRSGHLGFSDRPPLGVAPRTVHVEQHL